MQSSISNRSLITGNVSTDESKKEIRKSPGAPKVPANATTFCFHVFNPDAKRFSLAAFLVVAQLAAPNGFVGAGLQPGHS